MKKLLAILMVSMLVLTGCSTKQTEETTTLAIQAPGVESFHLEITGNDKNISKVAIVTAHKDASFIEMSEADKEEQIKSLLDSQEEIEGVLTTATIEEDIATVTITMTLDNMVELPSAFLLSDIRTVDDFKTIGAKDLIQQFVDGGATIVE